MPVPQESLPQDEPDPLQIELLGETERLRIETECRDFIESHKEKVPDGLARLVKEHAFVLVGETHHDEVIPIRQEIAKSLVTLREAGLTDVALELDSNKQDFVDSLDYSDPKIKDILSLKIRDYVSSGFLDILIAAKKAGLKVRLINCRYQQLPSWSKPKSKNKWVLLENERDEILFLNLELAVSENSKTLLYAGNNHIHSGIVEQDMQNGEQIERLGTRLVRKHGSQEVASVRFVDFFQRDNTDFALRFDTLSVGRSNIPSPQELWIKPNEPCILPDAGLLKGDKFTAASHIITMVGNE